MNSNLRDGLQTLQRRVIRVGLLSGVGRGMVAALVLILLFAWADLVVELPPTVRVAADAIALAGLVVLLGVAAMRAMRLATPAALARRVDNAIDAGGQVLAGVDLSLAPQRAGAAPVTAGLSRIAVNRATDMVRGVQPVAAVPARPAKRPFMLFGCMSVALVLGSFVSPRLFSTQFMRFTDPFGDHPPYSRLSFEVAPGGTSVIYGKSFDVQVKTNGPNPPERVELVYRVGGGADDVLPMFPQTDGTWQATLAGITSGGEYFVRAGRARSHKYPVGVITVPKIEDVRFRITPPAYTNMTAYEGSLPKSGIAGLPGTKVEMWVKSNRPLAKGTAQLATSPAPTTQPSPSAGAVALAPVADEASEVAGAFTITAPGKVTLAVTDVAGQSSTDSFTAPITVLSDGRPFVRVMEPKPESLATPDVTIDVILAAEDDYGVSRLQLFRTLNDSRASAVEIPVPQPAATRVPGSAPLKLSDYGLSEGDVVKLFARVEDTDPAGAKGSESPIVTLRIISQEQMKQLMLQRDAMETLQSKYEQAMRRLEGLDEQLKKLQEELAKQQGEDRNNPLDEKLRKALEEMAEDAAKDAQAIREAAREMELPIDLDKALSDELERAAARMEALAREGEKASQTQGLSVAGADDKVAEMRKNLGAAKEELKKEATEPLEHLAQVFPLLEDQARYLELYNRQRDLAERMASLKTQDAIDDPKVRGRMRDLEDEQRLTREELRKLLDEIDDHVAALPPDKKLDDLRKTASDFAEAVRASEAAPEMNKSETALSEFSGSRASVSSEEAADILESFISKCNGMGGEVGECLKFQPQLASGMGNTVQQLLDSMNLGSGMGGQGSGGGYSARRTTMQNVGLYGNLPQRTEQARSGKGGEADRGAFADGRGKDDSDDNASSGAEQADQTKTAGESADAVPAQYRRSVGEYFQRIADELGEK